MERGNGMELVKCPCCGEEYSPSYRKCPFCEEEEAPKRVKNKMRSGRRVTDKKKTHSGRGALIVILLLVLALLTWYLFGEKLMAHFAQTQEPKPPVEDVTSPEDEESDDPFYDPTIGGTEPTDVPDPNAVTPPVADEPSVDVTNAQLSRIDFTTNVGETVPLSVTGTAAVPVWASKDTAVATVDSTGLVTAVGAGTTLITATVGDRTLECIVRVKGTATNPGTVTPTADTSGAKLSTNDFTAGVGESVQLKVTGTNATVSWSVGNSGIASVSASGVVKGVKAGTTTVYAKVGSTTLECIVRIK